MFARILCRWRPSAVLPWSITTTTATILPLFGNTFAGQGSSALKIGAMPCRKAYAISTLLRFTVALAATSAARLSRSRGHSLTMLQSGSHVVIISFTNCLSMFIRPRSKPIKSSRISITATSSRFSSIATSRMCRRSHPCEGTVLYTTHS